jgi:DNA anti-recombination protein RmuC
MKKILFTPVMIALSGIIFSNQAFTGSFDQRQARQQKRISNEINNDQLTRQEAQRLKYEQRQIRRLHQSYSRDGQLTYREERRLNRLQDRTDRQITRLKQNSRRRNPYLQPYRRYTEPYRRLSDPYRRYWQ